MGINKNRFIIKGGFRYAYLHWRREYINDFAGGETKRRKTEK